MFGGVKGEAGDVVGVDSVTYEATGRMGVKTDHEKEREMVSVPERLKALCADPVVCGGIHNNHDEEHEVAGDAARLCVMDIEGSLLPNFCKEQ